MDAVKVWGFSSCVAVVIGSVISMIVPSFGKQNILRIVISAFVLVGMLSPALNIFKNFSVDDFIETNADYNAIEAYELNDCMLEELQEATTLALFPIVKEELLKFEISEDFGLNIELSQEDYGMKIEKVNITILDLHMIEKETVENYLKKEMGLQVNIDVIENEEKEILCMKS